MPTLNLQIGVGSGDAEEIDNNTSFNGTASFVRCRRETSPTTRYHCGMHYPSVAITVGSTINAATAQIYCHDATRNNMAGDIHMENLASPQNFLDNADVTDRALTSANTTWTADGLSVNVFTTSPDFAAAVQEVVNLGGWASGNPMTVIFRGRNGANKECRFRTFEQSASVAPKLDITFTAPGTGEILFRSTDKGMDRGTDRGIG